MRTWLITGANRGLGWHIANAAIAAGDNVVVTGRNLEKIAEAFSGYDAQKVVTLALNVAVEDQIRNVVQSTVATFGKIDILVNNAGYGQLGPFENNSATDIENQFSTNVFGMFNMCRAVLPIMRGGTEGHIFNIASIAGLVGMPGASVYCASKFAVVGFSESLAQEVAGFGIKVTVVSPGSFRTDFLDASSARFGSADISEYADFSRKIRDSSDKNNHAQQGDPAKLGSAIEQLALHPQAPTHFVVGSDAVELSASRLDIRQQELETWHELATSTDTDE
ncbi:MULTISPECIES: SDR family NAD(P)-dependent oxidoreductase [Pseudomonadaceae]|uniref:Short-chain dehydrogenase n=1 Tax=Halopseudomonas litoralis TaxID=797277 RepID=A0A1H1VXK0_9GAMM|nr:MULTISPECIES: SDR family NAD(P)-dependent oxidoreductase [Pseudomonadaceae]SDS89597.1 Short-chain dehydrogenase [Halopseudomonas litoralis]